MMAYSLSPWLKPRFFITGTNKPLAGGLMYTYKAGTTENATTYSNDTGTTNTNPIVLDSDGQCDLFLDDAVSYRIILKNSAGVTQFDKDRIASLGSTQVQSFNSIAALRLRSGTTIANAAKTLGYYSAGDGGGNSFYWDSTSVATDNAGTVIKPTAVSGAGRWLAVDTSHITPEMFGAKGDGVADDTAALQSALSAVAAAGGGILVFDGVYRLTENAAAGTQTRLTLAASNTTLIFSERTKFLVKSDLGITNVLVLAGVSNVRLIGTLRVESDGTTPYTTTGAYGAKALVIQNANGAKCGNIEIDSVRLTRGSIGVAIQNAYSASNRVDGINIGSIYTIDATYGLNAQNNGDNVVFGLLDTNTAYRSLFVYGVNGYKGFIRSINQYANGTPINVTQYSAAEGGSPINTQNIDVEVYVQGGTPSVVGTIRHIGDGGAGQVISNVFIRYAGLVPPPIAVSLQNYDTSGGAASSTPFAAKMENIIFENKMTQTLFTQPISFSPCSWVTKPVVSWVGEGTMTIAKWHEILQSVALYVSTPYGGMLIGSGGITLNNQTPIFALDASGVQSEIVRNDSSGNNRFGAATPAATYTSIFGGTNGIYLNTNNASRLQVVDTALRPQTDNVFTLGQAAQRFSVVYAGTGTINTSDARTKCDIDPLDAAEKRVAANLKAMVKKFRFKDAVAEKGSSARWHFGFIAQEVIAAFAAEGLSAEHYGLLCHDEWQAEDAVLDDEGRVVAEAVQAGDRYGIRYEELLAFIISAI